MTIVLARAEAELKLRKTADRRPSRSGRKFGCHATNQCWSSVIAQAGDVANRLFSQSPSTTYGMLLHALYTARSQVKPQASIALLQSQSNQHSCITSISTPGGRPGAARPESPSSWRSRTLSTVSQQNTASGLAAGSDRNFCSSARRLWMCGLTSASLHTVSCKSTCAPHAPVPRPLAMCMQLRVQSGETSSQLAGVRDGRWFVTQHGYSKPASKAQTQHFLKFTLLDYEYLNPRSHLHGVMKTKCSVPLSLRGNNTLVPAQNLPMPGSYPRTHCIRIPEAL